MNFVWESDTVDRELAMEVVRVTEVAALASAYWMGRGQKMKPMQLLRTHAQNV